MKSELYFVSPFLRYLSKNKKNETGHIVLDGPWKPAERSLLYKYCNGKVGDSRAGRNTRLNPARLQMASSPLGKKKIKIEIAAV